MVSFILDAATTQPEEFYNTPWFNLIVGTGGLIIGWGVSYLQSRSALKLQADLDAKSEQQKAAEDLRARRIALAVELDHLRDTILEITSVCNAYGTCNKRLNTDFLESSRLNWFQSDSNKVFLRTLAETYRNVVHTNERLQELEECKVDEHERQLMGVRQELIDIDKRKWKDGFNTAMASLDSVGKTVQDLRDMLTEVEATPPIIVVIPRSNVAEQMQQNQMTPDEVEELKLLRYLNDHINEGEITVNEIRKDLEYGDNLNKFIRIAVHLEDSGYLRTNRVPTTSSMATAPYTMDIIHIQEKGKAYLQFLESKSPPA